MDHFLELESCFFHKGNDKSISNKQMGNDAIERTMLQLVFQIAAEKFGQFKLQTKLLRRQIALTFRVFVFSILPLPLPLHSNCQFSMDSIIVLHDVNSHVLQIDKSHKNHRHTRLWMPRNKFQLLATCADN